MNDAKGWNGSRKGETMNTSARVRPARRFSAKPLAFALVLVLLGIVLAWIIFLSRNNSAIIENETSTSRITDIDCVPGNGKTGRALEPQKRERIPLAIPEISNKQLSPPKISTNSFVIAYGTINGKTIFKRPLFKHMSENVIASVIQTPLGSFAVSPKIPKNFEKDFCDSFKDEIVIDPEDSESEILAKQAMVDAKAEMLERMRAGEDIRKIIEDSRRELNQLAQYAEDVKRAYFALRKDAKDIKEVEEFRAEANKMLSAHGLPLIKAPRRGHYVVPSETTLPPAGTDTNVN